MAVVAEESGFARMRGYPTFFPYGDHRCYLRHTERLLRSLTAQGVPARVAPLDPEAYAAFCDAEGIDPDTPAGRARYTAEVAAHDALPYTGQPLRTLLPRLRTAARRRRTGQHAAELLALAAGDPVHGARLRHRAFQALARLAAAVGPGRHHLVGSVAPGGAPLVATLRLARTPQGALRYDAADAAVLATVLAAALAGAGPGGIVLRTTGGAAGGGDVLRGWQVVDGWLRGLTEAEVFDAYCTDPATGEPVPPEPGAEYRAGDPLPPPSDHPGPDGP